ncbi:hypothetical protein RHGRI_008275 [Rhododendron griersonianum]|uniref:Histone H2A/H2B/H3 domain-containing protein n=1 Tax=Rhododendron griersonianum TaxID=479676 RepID=A0AAV6L1Z8_9ERIC|nr:hypothetical protein RHGRI_008275 [Rhododendron griersonianum]
MVEVKKPQRYGVGRVAMREIKKYQESTELLIYYGCAPEEHHEPSSPKVISIGQVPAHRSASSKPRPPRRRPCRWVKNPLFCPISLNKSNPNRFAWKMKKIEKMED